MEKTDIIIIGAGPIGLEIAGLFKRLGLDYLHIEAGQIGQSMVRWPRDTCFFSSPEWIAIGGIPIHTRKQGAITGEEYLAYLRSVVELLDLHVRCYEPIVSLQKKGDLFYLTSDKKGQSRDYQSKYVVFASGDMSLPRKLNIPGEDLPHVSHYFQDPHLYFRQKLLIVGGRNSALEALLRCWRAGADIALSYRRRVISKDNTISRLKLEVDLLIKNKKVDFFPESLPVGINRSSVVLNMADGREQEVPADFVLMATGFIPDQSLLKEAGVIITGEESQPLHDPDTMETNVKGLFIAGTASAGDQQRYRSFITTCHPHGLKIVRKLEPGIYQSRKDELEKWLGNYSRRFYSLSPEDIE